MSINMNDYSSGAGGDLGQARPGPHIASLIGIVDLGVQNGGSWQGQAKPPCQQLILIFELLDDQVVIDNLTKNRIFSTKVWAKSGDKAKLSRIYNTLDPAGAFRGDLSQLLGVNCNLSLKAEAGTGDNIGKTFIKFDGIMAAMQGQQFPPTMNEFILFNQDDLASVAVEYKKLHGWMRECVKAGLEYQGSQLAQVIAQVEAQEQAVPQPQGQPLPQQQAPLPQAGVGQTPGFPAATGQAPAPAQGVQYAQAGLPGAPVNAPVQQQTTAPSQAPTPALSIPPFPGAGQIPANGAPVEQAQIPAQTVTPAATNIPQAPPGFQYDPATGGFLPIPGGV